MKVLIATDKPFAKIAVDGIRKEIEAERYFPERETTIRLIIGRS